MAEPYYCTIAELRDHLNVTEDTLGDAAALVVIEDAEDVIDSMLGARNVDDVTGRKVVEADVDAWRFTKLTRATLKVAAILYAQPGVLTRQQWQKQSGPDFTMEGPSGDLFGSDVGAVLDQSGLRRLTTRVGAGVDSRPPWWPLVYNDPDEV